MFHNLIKVSALPNGEINLPNTLPAFLWFFLRQAKGPFLLIFAIFAISNISEALNFYFIKVFVDVFAAAEQRQDIWSDMLWPLVIFTLLCLILQPVTARIAEAMMASAMPAFANMMRRQLSIYMNNHSFAYFQDDFAGRLASKVIETPYAARNIVQALLDTVFFALTTLIASLVFMALSHWSFAAITLAWIAAYILLLKIYIPKISQDSKEAHDLVSITRGRYVDIITNILTVKIFARRAHEDQHFLSSLEKTSYGFQILQHRINSMYIWLEVLSVLYIIAAFACVIWGWQHEILSAGDVAMILPLSIRLMNISWWMSDTISMLFESLGQLKEGMETITTAHSVTDKPGAPKLHVNSADIEIKEMSFEYGDKK